MSIRNMDRKVALILMAIAVFYLILSYQLPDFAFVQVDADALPKGLGFLLLILAVLLFVHNKPETEEEIEKRTLKKEDKMLLIYTLISLLLFVFFLEILGFVLSTVIFLIVTMRMFEYRNWTRSIIVSVVFSLILYFSFNYVLKIYLPQGILPF
ncbi:tripartite tricarboxylate transporter TctB family protein [Sporosarcina sp. FA9]|uniref:tripartite tricarboxylate transporter TctB family protein n=1 Tax=Sporosarcina sp. FA9 TaxID=3413030 RepID=UPI003F656E6D